MIKLISKIAVFVFLSFQVITIFAADNIGVIKKSNGLATISRGGEEISVTPGMDVYSADVVSTGPDGKVGILFNDDSRISLAGNSKVTLGDFYYQKDTRDGDFEMEIEKGTLSVISGKMTEKKAGSMRVQTPAAILAVRGTEFSVKVY